MITLAKSAAFQKPRESDVEMIKRRSFLLGSTCMGVLAMSAPPAVAQSGEITISHYFTGELGLKAFNDQVAKFTEATGIAVRESPVGHEDFKTDILVRAAGNSLPDVFSYWAGARVQFIVDSGRPIPVLIVGSFAFGRPGNRAGSPAGLGSSSK